MLDIYFVTSNSSKVTSLRERLNTNKYEVIQTTLQVPEIQAATALDVARHKATYAFDKLQKPLVVQDSSFHINALLGFPGPYIKYINETIGIEGLLQLMQGAGDRTAYFEQALIYMDAGGKLHQFTATSESGTIALEAYDANYKHSWSELWRIYKPGEDTKTLAELFESGKRKTKDIIKDDSELAQFVRWLELNL
jgi:non-canonical purine NTP pyrophosphatase (RdgB/HAM1 family)